MPGTLLAAIDLQPFLYYYSFSQNSSYKINNLELMTE